MKTVPCKGCGKPIVWAKDDKGTSHPLDARAPVYHFNGGDLDGEFQVHRLTGAWVSHFSTCPKASEFSKGKKAAASTGVRPQADPEGAADRNERSPQGDEPSPAAKLDGAACGGVGKPGSPTPEGT